MFLLSKLLPLFVLPLGVSLILLTWGVLQKKRRPMVLGLVVLFVFTQPYVGFWLLRSAEDWAERPAVATMPMVDAIVVLSAGRVVAPGPDRVSEWGDANRFFGGVELFLAGKAPRLVFTLAVSPWAPNAPAEGDILAGFAERLGVPRGAVVLAGPVQNTADEARETLAALRSLGLQTPRILLVTSAFHMPRARGQFEMEGHSVVPFPVDFTFSVARAVTVLDFVPSVGALMNSHAALREFYGRAYYWLRSR